MKTTRQSGSMRNFTAVMIVLVCCLAVRTTGSAIPMWEFLTKSEKLSHLEKLFRKQVGKYCSDSSVPDCDKNLLIVGVQNLASMDENELDLMDPYQRDADDIIWRAIIGDSKLPAKYGHEESYYMGEADPLATSESDHNGLGEESSPISDYVRPSDHSGPYLVGPMVIRVFPDGRPVPEDAKRPLPRDDDIEDTRYSKIPSVADIEASDNGFFYNRPSYRSVAGSNRVNVYVYDKPLQRPSHVSTINNSRYLGFNVLFRDRRMPENSNNARTFRFY